MATLNQIMDYQADHGVYETLLWTNNSPTSSFGAQSVSIDLSDYQGVDIVWRWSTSDTGMFRQSFDKDTSSMIFSMANTRTYRELTVSDSGVTFTTGYYAAYNASAATSAYYAIPVKIYGVKRPL
jgi:hypothetical protein